MADQEEMKVRKRNKTEYSDLLVRPGKVRQYLLEEISGERYYKFTQVAPNVYHEANEVVKQFLRDKLKAQPSSGKTIR